MARSRRGGGSRGSRTRTPSPAAEIRRRIAALQRQLRAAERREAQAARRAASETRRSMREAARAAQRAGAAAAKSARRAGRETILSGRELIRAQQRGNEAQARATEEFLDRVRAMQLVGIPRREIARRTGLSEGTIRDAQSGRRNLSPRLAEKALQRLDEHYSGPRTVVSGGQRFIATPVGQAPREGRMPDREKMGAWRRLMREAIKTGDYRLVGKGLRRSDRRVRITDGSGKSRVIVLETDPDVLRAMVEGGLISLDDLEGPS